MNSGRVTDIALERILGKDKHEVIWQVAKAPGGRLNEFVIGEVPDGFTELVPLTFEIPPEAGLILSVARQFTVTMEIHPNKLKDGLVEYTNRSITEEQFWAIKDCRTR